MFQWSGDIKEEYKSFFTDFLDQEFKTGTYKEKVRLMVANNETRLIVNLNDLRLFKSDVAHRFLKDPNEYLPSWEAALQACAELFVTKQGEATKRVEYHLGFTGSVGAHHVSPRDLSTDLLRCLVCVEGIVIKCSIVRPKIVKSVHYCEATGQTLTRHYRDETTPSGIPTPAIYPTKDDAGNPLSTEFGLSVFRDSQTLTMQEMPERAPAGQLPRSIDVIVQDDLVDRVKPGDRIRLYGIYRALPKTRLAGGHLKAVFKTALIANNVKLLNKEKEGPQITPEDIRKIQELAQRPDIFDLLSRSLAPSIFGHHYLKKAILLQLLGGLERNVNTGTHIRGDINVLLVGDPSTAKSQLLRFVLNIAPLAISTSGRGVSGVGLTAAVTSDPETGERRLEAGAMVLADRGIVCIDEFDKMSVEDRIAIHEVMEQQTVTIAKAGIHTSLNARCAVLAAANPVYGKYDKQRKPWENIGLPDSLLSRFDLLFIVLDQSEPEYDRNIAQHVLRMHRYRHHDEQEGIPFTSVNSGAVVSLEEDEHKPSDLDDVWEKRDRTLYADSRTKSDAILSIAFIKKYLLYAKSRIIPTLGDAATATIIEAYTELRSREDTKTLPITARTLETIIRLSVAHAKCRLSNEVQEVDVTQALKVMRYALYHDTSAEIESTSVAVTTSVHEPAMPRRTGENTQTSVEERHDDSALSQQTQTRRRKKQRTAALEKSDTDKHKDDSEKSSQQTTAAAVHSKERLKLLQQAIYSAFKTHRNTHSLPITVLAAEANKNNAQPFSEEELHQLLTQLDANGVIMYTEGQIHLL